MSGGAGGGMPNRPGGGSARGRRPGASDTRERILAAARAAFGERGLDGATLRDIASRAGVDPALVHHYFGTKQQLFVAAMEFPIDIGEVFAVLATGPRETIGERIVHTFVEVWDRPEIRPLVLGLIRSATTDATAGAMFRQLLAAGPLRAVAASVEAPDAPLRATLVASALIGLAMVRYVGAFEPIISLDAGALAALVGPTVTRYLAGDLGATNPGPVG